MKTKLMTMDCAYLKDCVELGANFLFESETDTSDVLRAFTNEVKRRYFDQHGKPQPQYSYMDIAMFLMKELGIEP